MQFKCQIDPVHLVQEVVDLFPDLDFTSVLGTRKISLDEFQQLVYLGVEEKKKKAKLVQLNWSRNNVSLDEILEELKNTFDLHEQAEAIRLHVEHTKNSHDTKIMNLIHERDQYYQNIIRDLKASKSFDTPVANPITVDGAKTKFYDENIFDYCLTPDQESKDRKAAILPASLIKEFELEESEHRAKKLKPFVTPVKSETSNY